MKFKPLLHGVPLLAALTAALYWYSGRESAASATPPVGARPAPVRPDAWLAGPGAMPQPPKPDASVPLSVQIDKLVATGGAAGAFQAYLLVDTCVDFADKGDVRRFDPTAEFHMRGSTDEERKELSALCGGMTERIKASRIEHLAIAAKAGISGAAAAFLRAGPFGDPSALETRPSDPLVVEWRRQAAEQLASAAQAGDMTSMMVLMNEYGGYGKALSADPVLALRYTYAVGLIHEEMLRNAGQSFPNVFKEMADRAKAGLTPEQIAAQQSAGKALADKAAEARPR